MTSTTVTPDPDEQQPASTALASECRGYADFLDVQSTDVSGFIELGRRNVADLVSVLHRAADALDAAGPARLVEYVRGARLDVLTDEERDRVLLAAEIGARLALRRMNDESNDGLVRRLIEQEIEDQPQAVRVMRAEGRPTTRGTAHTVNLPGGACSAQALPACGPSDQKGSFTVSHEPDPVLDVLSDIGADTDDLRERLARIDAKIDRLVRPTLTRGEALCAILFAGGIALSALGLALQFVGTNG